MTYNDLLKCEEFDERKASIVRCHATLLVHCMTAQIVTTITHMALRAKINCQKTLIPMFRLPFSLKPLILWSPKMVASKLITRTSVFDS